MNFASTGKLQVILGPMFSGKTSELVRTIQRFKLAGYTCLIIRYINDTRYSSDSVSTHDGYELPAISASKLKDIENLITQYDVIGIDEGQFFPDLVEFCDSHCNSGKKMVVAGLDATYQRTGFANMLSLIPLAESVVKLSAICMSCSNEASFTKRIGSETEVELIGGAEKYMAVCRECYKQVAPVKRSPFKHFNGLKLCKAAPKKSLLDSFS